MPSTVFNNSCCFCVQVRFSEEAAAEARELGLELVQGCEISCEWTFANAELAGKPRSKAHLLAYFTKSEPTSQLAVMLSNLRRNRNQR